MRPCPICQHEFDDHDLDYGCLGGDEDCQCDGYMDFVAQAVTPIEEDDLLGVAAVEAWSRPSLTSQEAEPLH